MTLIRFCLIAVLSLGCGVPLPSGHAHPAADAGLEEPSDAGPGDGLDAGSPDAGSVDAGALVPGVPVLVSVAFVSHSMSIAWQLPLSGCAGVSLRMKPAGGAYSTVSRLAGVTTSTQYNAGHGSGTFCFQVTCTLGGTESAPSNELCATQ